MAKSKVAVENSKPNYYTFITPLYYMSKASGQWPQTLRRSSPGFTVTSVVYLFVVYIGIGYCIYVNSSVALWKQYLQQMESPILQYGLQAHIINGLIMENIFLLLVILGYYYLLAFKLQIQTQLLYTSYYIVNMTSLVFVTEYIFFTFTVKARVAIVNRLLKQLLFEDFEHNRGDLTIATPTIAYEEIFTIDGKLKEAKIQTKEPQEMVKPEPTNVRTFADTLRILFDPLNDSKIAFNVTSIRFQLMAAANGFWIIYYMVTIVVIIYAASSTIDVLHSSGDVVHQIIRSKQKTFNDAIIEKVYTYLKDK
nr:uncharacterized protein LOC115266679 [Aedes albopictus]